MEEHQWDVDVAVAGVPESEAREWAVRNEYPWAVVGNGVSVVVRVTAVDQVSAAKKGRAVVSEHFGGDPTVRSTSRRA